MSMSIPIYDGAPFALTAAQMADVDRAMTRHQRVELMQMMELAGRHLAHLARVRFLDGDPVGRAVTVLAGSGGNGGGALVAARRLAAWGARVQVMLSRPPDAFDGVPGHQLEVARRQGLPCHTEDGLRRRRPSPEPELILDGLIGYRLSGPPRAAVARWIEWTHARTAPILALDVPSGFDAQNAVISEPAVRAAATLTLALPKVGLQDARNEAWVGELYLADIGVPPDLYERRFGVEVDVPFASDDLVRLRPRGARQSAQ